MAMAAGDRDSRPGSCPFSVTLGGTRPSESQLPRGAIMEEESDHLGQGQRW